MFRLNTVFCGFGALTQTERARLVGFVFIFSFSLPSIHFLGYLFVVCLYSIYSAISFTDTSRHRAGGQRRSRLYHTKPRGRLLTSGIHTHMHSTRACVRGMHRSSGRPYLGKKEKSTMLQHRNKTIESRLQETANCIARDSRINLSLVRCFRAIELEMGIFGCMAQ